MRRFSKKEENKQDNESFNLVIMQSNRSIMCYISDYRRLYTLRE